MPIRTTESAVKAIRLATGEATVSSLTPFIETASALVDELCVNSGYSNARLELIERWLSAHFYSILDPQSVREEVSTLRQVFQQEVKLGLDQTRYGQQAKLLDTAGNLAKLDEQVKKPTGGFTKPGISWLGSED